MMKEKRMNTDSTVEKKITGGEVVGVGLGYSDQRIGRSDHEEACEETIPPSEKKKSRRGWVRIFGNSKTVAIEHQDRMKDQPSQIGEAKGNRKTDEWGRGGGGEGADAMSLRNQHADWLKKLLTRKNKKHETEKKRANEKTSI